MFKRLASFFLIVLIVCSSFNRLFFFAGYELNKNYIANVLCENKDKPQLNCEGKCFLSKKIAEAEKKQEHNTKQIQKDLYPSMMISKYFTFYFHQNIPQLKETSYLNFYHLYFTSKIFHPPAIV